jgi:DNA-binding PadR family transcriptional regulator
MPIQHAVLALLRDRPAHGYELKRAFESSIGPQWGELNIGHLYQVLERLVRDGLVTKRTVSQADRPDKIVYRLTSGGRRELEAWLASPFAHQTGYRDDFFLKLFAAARLGPDWVSKVTRVQRQAYLNELAALTRIRSSTEHESIVRLLTEAAILHTEANLRIVDLAEDLHDRLHAEAQAHSGGELVDEAAEERAG